MPRKFSRVDAGRTAITLIMFAVVFAAWYFLLPLIQSAIVPRAPGGATGPWVIRPILAARFCASGITSAVSAPFVFKRFGARWRAADAAAGTRYDPYRARPVAKALFMLKGVVLAMIYASALLFYLFSWTTVGQDGIEDRWLWRRSFYAFDQIASLRSIPSGMRSEESGHEGPWYRVEFADHRSVTFGRENEGCSDADLNAVATFLAQRSGESWQVPGDAKPR